MKLIHVYTGDGKGKTSALLGLSIRAAGSGMKVLYTHFLKDKNSGEFKVLENIENIELFIHYRHFGFIKYMSEEEFEEAKNYYSYYFEEIIKKINEKKYDVLVMDEFMAAYNYDIIDKNKALNFLKSNLGKFEIALSGRDVADEILELADYVSSIEAIKHPFTKGIKARKGIEY